ncbi:NAD(P)/FAD-dependent oxidoreductase [Peptoniphilus sp. AGMB00490]|uniref:NAD(P)/FAD-dependent oxidoreductase n=1 Tax=Peptoniphilus faecalis TaxID=2731255 RepID=A0A848RDN2_9FIRM|nr:NAD(P)/FAD-dependent oxidoreductase [Peptoniphilus faecalis]NMW84145.1 NAD(P)/FAD-dependent oxidoreductase [Peptoniphilus faecalis]
MKDIIIIGAGPSGVSAALYAKARGKDILILEKEQIGGIIGHVSKVSHYASVDKNETGESFRKKLEAQLKYSNIEVVYEKAISIKKETDKFIIATDKDTYEAKKVIYAAGSKLKELEVDEIKSYHWPFGKEDLLKDKLVIINGGSDGAAKEGLYISKFAREVHIVQDKDKLLCIDEFKKKIEDSSNIIVHTSEKIVSKVSNSEIKLSSGKTIKDKDEILVFVQIGQSGNSDILKNLENFDLENSFVKTDIESTIDGLFFAGDIRVKSVRQVSTAVCDGTIAGIKASQSL